MRAVSEVEQLLISHRESGGNIHEAVERNQASITQATAGYISQVEKEWVVDHVDGRINEDKLAANHLEAIAKYSSLINGAQSNQGVNLESHVSDKLVNPKHCSLCPPDLFAREEFFKECFAVGSVALRRFTCIKI